MSLLTSVLRYFVNSNQISHSHHYDYSNCNWQTRSTDEIDIISSSPSGEEIFRKLSMAKNTSPEKDKLDYIHIKSINIRCILMYEILTAVHKIGIHMNLNVSKIILIYKKDSTTDLSNAFALISHSTLLNIVDSLPITHHIIYLLRDIYSNNSYEYQDFTVSSITRVRH